MTRERLRYWFDNTMSKGTPALIGWLAVVSALLIAVVTLVAWPFADGLSPMRVAWMSLLRTLDPGTMGGDDGDSFFVLMMLVVTLGGIFIVSALVGVLSAGLDAKLDELRKGRSRVVEHGHTVVLGWSEEIFAVISELVKAKKSERKPVIAVLADRDKVQMEDELRARLGEIGGIRLVVRSGDPAEPSSLALVSPHAARSVLILSADDAELVKTLLALGSRRWAAAGPSIIAAVADSGNLTAARIAGGPHAEVVDSQNLAARLVVQSCRQSGLSAVYTELLDFDGDEIYLWTERRLVGRRYGEALFAFGTATVIGLRLGGGRVALNPHSDTVIGENDQLILIAPDDSEIRPATAPPTVLTSAIRPPRAPGRAPARTLILGHNRRRGRIMRELGHHLLPGSEIHLVGPPAEGGALPPDVLVTAKQGDITDRATLEALNPGVYDQVIVLACDTYEPQKADARTMVTLLHLRDMDTGAAIVSEMNDERNRLLAQVAEADDFVVGGRLVSMLLTQLSENRHLGRVFDVLLAHDGPDIYLEPAENYLAPGATVTFATVIEAARQRGETAFGYRLSSESGTASHHGVRLNPPKSEPLAFRPGDQVVVLADR
uniref:CASTOR/POLLUX-related putative ion channel n=1 Tax=Nonomuraea pusilla TaxID=46177 RepID=UPI000A80D266